MPQPSPAENKLLAQERAYLSWANTPDRAARTAPAREGLEQKFLREADGDADKAKYLRKAYFTRLSLRSAQARRKAREHIEVAEAVEAELDAFGGAV
jgi:hypothetical protein